MLNNIVRRTINRLSRLFLPESRRRVTHAHINGYDLLVLANEDVGRAIYFCHNYEMPETTYLSGAIASNATCIDIGANVGYFSILMAKAAHDGKVIAFDPLPLNAALLRASAELNGLRNIEVVECVLGDREAEVALVQSSDGAYSSLHDTARKPVEKIVRVPMLTLDAFIQARGIASVDVLKVDVEGAEGLILSGARRLLADVETQPKIIIMELFDENFAAYGTSRSAIIAAMRNFGYTPYHLNDKARPVAFSDAEAKERYNVLFLSSRGLPGK